MIHKGIIAGAFVLTLLGGAVVAQESNDMNMEDHDMSQMGEDEVMPSSQAYMLANEEMMMNMGGELTGDADVDFAQQMIPHHDGAIAMAKVELQFGKDPEMRKLAENVIKAQEAENAFLKEWLAKHGK